MDVFIAGMEEGENTAYAAQGSMVYLEGPGISTLKQGGLYRVVRPEGKVQDRLNGEVIGIYYLQLGTLRVERAHQEGAVAKVQFSCRWMLKGDLVIPLQDRPSPSFSGDLATRLTPPAEGLASSIILAEHDGRELASGNFCFIGVGARDGVKPGDRFTIYRMPPSFNSTDLLMYGGEGGLSYQKMIGTAYRKTLEHSLSNRKLPPRAVGDLVVLAVEDTTAAAKIINSLSEIHPGDMVVRR